MKPGMNQISRMLVINYRLPHEFLCLHNNDVSRSFLLGCEAIPTFQRSMLPPFWGWIAIYGYAIV